MKQYSTRRDFIKTAGLAGLQSQPLHLILKNTLRFYRSLHWVAPTGHLKPF